jgi:hypothetical protein
MAVSRGTVRKKAKGLIAETWQSQANLSLFLFLEILVAFVLPVLGFGREDTVLYSDVGFSVLLISGAAIAWGQWKLFAAASVVSGAALVVRWIVWFHHTTLTKLWSDGSTMLAVAVIALVLLKQIFRPGRVSHLRIQGAIAVYLLFGVVYAHAYQIVDILQPGSFHGPGEELSNVSGWVYYSYVTLTTVGYGDITPVSQVARTLSVGEALTGQLYLAVLIARLVAMEIVFWQQKVQSGEY